MARITTNTTGTQPVIIIGLSGANLANTSATINIPYIQDLTITNSTGVYAYTDFSDADQRKLSTPADNKLSTNVVVDDTTYFGNANATANTAAFYGIASLSTNKNVLDFQVYWNGTANTAQYYTGTGFLTNLAPKTSPTAPVWVTPLDIAVDGHFFVNTPIA
jgi:hypothetical protein